MSKETTTKHSGYDAYQEYVNIELFNDIIAFVMATAAADKTPLKKSLGEKHLWYAQSDSGNIQERYGFRYFGELLERFEDKAGSDKKNIRAIALAMAYAKDLLTDDMFVGNQKHNFISKITQLSPDDIYLKGALYLLKKDESGAGGLLDELTQTNYARTEELIFAMSLYDDFEQAFLTFKPQLISLLGVSKTISAAGNAGIFCWLIKQLCRYSKIKEIRTKDIILFRALTELPISFVKKGSRHHGVLLDNGYTAEDILYLNSYIIRSRPIRGTIDVNSVVAEKIAVEACKTFINSENTHSAEVYEHLEWLLKKYDDFAIKINGNKGIYQAIENDIAIKNPQTFLWLYKLIQPKNLFRFDILDEKWDILSRELNAGAYQNLFKQQLVENPDHTQAQIMERIQKYNALTGTSYLVQFDTKYDYHMENVFALMVEKNIINLKAAFTACPGIGTVKDDDKDKARPPMLHYIRRYIMGIRSRESFDFFKDFFRDHDFNDMHRLFTGAPGSWNYRNNDSFFVDELYKGPVRYYGDSKQNFDIKRSFLSDEEHRELFEWLDDYMLKYKADKYAEFASLMLLDPFIVTLYPKEELRKIYDMVRGMDIAIMKHYSNELNRRYLSEAEFQAEQEAEEARKQEQRQKEHEQKIQKMRDELAAGYDGSFESLLKYLDAHRYSGYDDATSIAAEYLEIALAEKRYVLSRDELGRFLQLCVKLLQKGYFEPNAIKKYISTIEEEPKNVENKRTVEPDSDFE